jgi:DNA-binding NarL/FixJ family response regulator
MPLRLVIADDHPLLVDGLKGVLQDMEEVEVVSTASNGWELISILHKINSKSLFLPITVNQNLLKK